MAPFPNHIAPTVPTPSLQLGATFSSIISSDDAATDPTLFCSLSPRRFPVSLHSKGPVFVTPPCPSAIPLLLLSSLCVAPLLSAKEARVAPSHPSGFAVHYSSRLTAFPECLSPPVRISSAAVFYYSVFSRNKDAFFFTGTRTFNPFRSVSGVSSSGWRQRK